MNRVAENPRTMRLLCVGLACFLVALIPAVAGAEFVRVPACKSVGSTQNCMLNLEVFQFSLKNKQDFLVGGWNTLKATALQLYCAQHKSISNCTNDVEHMCRWHGEVQACGLSPNGYQALIACPGSKAREWFSCMASYNPTNGSCALADCVLSVVQEAGPYYGGLSCLPTWYASMESIEQEIYRTQLKGNHPAVWGCCASTKHHLTSHLDCTQYVDSATCSAQPSCMWDTTPASGGRGLCHQSSDAALSGLYGVVNLPQIREQSRWCRSFGPKTNGQCMEGSMTDIPVSEIEGYADVKVENPEVPCWEEQAGKISAAHGSAHAPADDGSAKPQVVVHHTEVDKEGRKAEWWNMDGSN